MFPDTIKRSLVFVVLFLFFVPRVGIAKKGKFEPTKNTAEQKASQKTSINAAHKISLSLKKADLLDVLKMLAKKTRWNLVIGQEVSGEISLNLHNVAIEDALVAVVRIAGYAIERQDDILYVTTREKVVGLPFLEETENRYYKLTFIKLDDAAAIIKNYLSPHGKLTLHESLNTLLIKDIPEVFVEIDALLKEIDQLAIPEKFEHRIYEFLYMDVKEAASVIKGYLSPYGKLSVKASSDQLFVDDIPEVIEKIEPVIHFLDQAPIPKKMPTRTYRLAYVSAEDAEKVIKEYLSPYGKMTVHKSGDTLFIEETSEAFEKIEKIIAELDRPPKQVMIEAKIFEVQLNDDLAYGVNWNVLLNSDKETFTGQTSGLSKTIASGGEGFFFGVTTPEITMFLDALEKKGNLNTLATPRLLALNHKPARIVIGGRLGFKVTTTTNLVTQESVEFLDTGTQLRITPHIDDNGNILMDIHPEISDGIITEGLPAKTTTEVTTTLMAKDGESIFIGGLIREREEEIVQKVPILGYIPLLSFFFSRTEIKKLKSEIIVIITPHLEQQQVKIPPTLE